MAFGKKKVIIARSKVAPAETLKKAKAAADEVTKTLAAKYGEGTLMRMGDRVGQKYEVIRTNIYTLDNRAIQAGGVPRGRVIEIYGPESCLDENTFVQFEIKKQDGTRVNHKGGTVKRLYERFHGTKRHHLQSTDDSLVYSAPCVNEEGRIFHNRVLDVVHTGVQNVLTLRTEGGFEITATKDHKFFDGLKWRALSELSVGDIVMTHNSTPFTCDVPERIERSYLYVKQHKVAGVKEVFDKKTGNTYVYRRLAKSRAAVEAENNGLSLSEYVERLNSGDITSLTMLPREWHVHHIDEDATNDELSNLVVITDVEHGVLHAVDRHNNLGYMVVEDRIASIVSSGASNTYDIKMASPFNNFVANNFVVHNSGKTTLTLQIIAEAQAAGELAGFIDAEHALDPNWATINGVDMDELRINQPDDGEQALDILEEMVRSGAFAVIVVDSVAALVPKAELAGEMGDSHVGLQARLMSQALRKLTGIVQKSRTTVIFINQIREKIGVMFGNPETTTGGRALKFYASVRIDVRKIATVKDGEEPVGARTKFKIVKNKVGAPFRETEVTLLFKSGYDVAGNLIEAATESGIVEKSGSWYSYAGERIGQGILKTSEFLNENPEVYEKIYAATVAHDTIAASNPKITA